MNREIAKLSYIFNCQNYHRNYKLEQWIYTSKLRLKKTVLRFLSIFRPIFASLISPTAAESCRSFRDGIRFLVQQNNDKHNFFQHEYCTFTFLTKSVPIFFSRFSPPANIVDFNFTTASSEKTACLQNYNAIDRRFNIHLGSNEADCSDAKLVHTSLHKTSSAISPALIARTQSEQPIKGNFSLCHTLNYKVTRTREYDSSRTAVEKRAFTPNFVKTSQVD